MINYLSILVEGNYRSLDWSDRLLETSLIERNKKRNYTIAVTTAVIVTIVSVATLIFSLNAFIALSPFLISTGVVLKAVAIPILFWSLPVMVKSQVNSFLHNRNVVPLRKFKVGVMNEVLLKDLIVKCDESALKKLTSQMNFVQLGKFKDILSRKTFKEMVHNVNRNWELILSFEEMNTIEQCDFIKNNLEFLSMVTNHKQAAWLINKMIFQKNEAELIEAFKDHANPGCLRWNQENPLELCECLNATDISKDWMKISHQYGINQLTIDLIQKMVKKGVPYDMELYAWISENLMDPEFELIRSLFDNIILQSIDDFKFLWPYESNWGFIQYTCLSYFNTTLDLNFRAAYEAALSLDSLYLKGICLEYLRNATPQQKILVQSCYQNHESIPDEIQHFYE